MKVRIILAFMAVAWLAVGTRASGATAENPYAAITTRNVFDLQPIPVTSPADDGPPATPPPKITPNGIMTIFGSLQVLFKVATPAAGRSQPAKDTAYVMGVGDRQDGITVQKIDQTSATITFDNHGTIQELPLVAATGGKGSAPTGVPSPPGRPATAVIPAPGPRPEPVGFGGRFGRSRSVPLPANNSDSGNSVMPTFGNSTVGTAASQPAPPPLTPEEQVIMIEAQRMQMKADGDPTAAILPPTAMTPAAGADNATSGGATPTPGK